MAVPAAGIRGTDIGPAKLIRRVMTEFRHARLSGFGAIGAASASPEYRDRRYRLHRHLQPGDAVLGWRIECAACK